MGPYSRFSPRIAGSCWIPIIRAIHSRNHCSTAHGMMLRYLDRRNAQKNNIIHPAHTAMRGKYSTPYCNEIGRSIPASAQAGPYALCGLLQNIAAMIPAHTPESSHMTGVHPQTIASEIAIGTLTSATAIHGFRFVPISFM